MLTRRRAMQLCTVGIACCCVAFSQQKMAAPLAPYAQDLPAVMQQSVSAGKTAVGTKVRAKLEVPTLLEGKVLPRNATLTGEVIESAAKTATTPSRLAIRMDSAEWKGGNVALKAFLTAWYYPATAAGGQSLQYGPAQSPGKVWNGQGAYPNPNSPSYKPFPGGDSEEEKSSVPDTAATKVSNHRVLMKDVEWLQSADGNAVLVCKRSNLKLDKLTTYIFATSVSPSAK
jgi:hypothetical protein